MLSNMLVKEPDEEVSVLCCVKESQDSFSGGPWVLGASSLMSFGSQETQKKHSNNGFHRPHTHGRWHKTAEPSQQQLPVPTAGSPDPQSSQESPSTGLPSLPDIWIASQDWKVSDPLKCTQSGRIRTGSSCVLSLNIKGPYPIWISHFYFPHF